MTSAMQPSKSESKDKEAGSTTAGGSTADKAAAQETEGVTVDHGEKPGTLKEQEKAEKETAKDPWGTTPMQSRELDEDNMPKGRSSAVDGISPHLQEHPEGQEVVGGTLPPV